MCWVLGVQLGYLSAGQMQIFHHGIVEFVVECVDEVYKTREEKKEILSTSPKSNRGGRDLGIRPKNSHLCDLHMCDHHEAGA